MRTEVRRGRGRARRRRPRAGLLCTALAAIAVVIGGCGNANDSSDEADTATPVEIVNAYMAARAGNDPATAIELLHPEAVIADTPRGATASNVAITFAWLDMYGESLEYTCSEGQPIDGSQVAVDCEYALTTQLSEIVGHIPEHGQMRLRVDGGLITALLDSPPPDYVTNVHRPFMDWLIAEDSEARNLLYGGQPSPLLTKEAILAYAEYIQRFARSREAE